MWFASLYANLYVFEQHIEKNKKRVLINITSHVNKTYGISVIKIQFHILYFHFFCSKPQKISKDSYSRQLQWNYA